MAIVETKNQVNKKVLCDALSSFKTSTGFNFYSLLTDKNAKKKFNDTVSNINYSEYRAESADILDEISVMQADVCI